MKKPLIAVALASALALSAGGGYLWLRPAGVTPPGALAAETWCALHDAPGDACTACHPELVAGFKERNDWCAGHGLPESHCEACNPGVLTARRSAAQAASAVAAWCTTHDAPGDACTTCHPELVAGFKERNDWCAGHGLPESHCEACNPGVLTARRAAAQAASAAAAWCTTHDAPGDACTACNPELVAGFKERNDWCAGHGLPESHCERCNPGVLTARRAAAQAASAAAAWCTTHDAPGDACTACHPALVAGFKERNDWCAGHGLPESHCERCNPGVLTARREAAQSSSAAVAWCTDHDRPEAECTECRPELVAGFKERADWCAGHGLPESHCERCNPGVLATRRPAASAAPAAPLPVAWCEHDRPGGECTACAPARMVEFLERGDWCPEHALPASHCETCDPGVLSARRRAAAAAGAGQTSALAARARQDLPRHRRPPTAACDAEAQQVRLATPAIAERAGLQVAAVARRALARSVEGNVRLDYDRNRLVHLAPRTAGTLVAVKVDLGDRVERGQVLAEVNAVAVGAAKAAFLQAQALVELWEQNLTRERGLLEQRVGTQRDVLEAETRLAENRIALAKGRQDLLNLGLLPAEVAAVASSGDTSARVAVRASMAGVVIAREAAAGEVVDPSRPLFTLGDLSRLWALVDVREEDAARVRVGQSAEVTSDGLPGQVFRGQVTWISPSVDRRTRTVQVRVELANPDGALRANAFGRAAIAVEEASPRVLLPREAAQWDGCCNLVFLRRSPTVYEPRKVQLGDVIGGAYEVLSGLEGGEEVVTVGSFLLRTEILKANIGAGCCEPVGGE